MQGRTNGHQQEIDGCLHRGTHTDDGERVVQLDQEIANYAVEDETQRRVCPCRDIAAADGLPQRVTALRCRHLGQQGGSQHPAEQGQDDGGGKRKASGCDPVL